MGGGKDVVWTAAIRLQVQNTLSTLIDSLCTSLPHTGKLYLGPLTLNKEGVNVGKLSNISKLAS